MSTMMDIDYCFRPATITFKEWKGKPRYYVFYIDAKDDPQEEAKKILKELADEKGWKRRKALSVTVDYPLNITIR